MTPDKNTRAAIRLVVAYLNDVLNESGADFDESLADLVKDAEPKNGEEE